MIKFVRANKTIEEADHFAPDEYPYCSKCGEKMELFCDYLTECPECTNCSEGVYVCPNCEKWWFDEWDEEVDAE